MAEDKKPAVKASLRQLAQAGASGDPAVHQLLAELQTARMNGNAAGIAAATQKLAELGYE